MRYALFIFFYAHACMLPAQQKPVAKLKVESERRHGTAGNLLRFQKVEYFTVTLSSRKMKVLDIYLVAKTYDVHGLTGVDTVLNTRSFERAYFGSNTSAGKKFSFALITQNNLSDSFRVGFYFPRTSDERTYRKLRRDDYSLRDAIGSEGEYIALKADSLYPVLVYSLPYEDPQRPGSLLYCALTAESVPPSQWGAKYGVKHCIVYEVTVR